MLIPRLEDLRYTTKLGTNLILVYSGDVFKFGFFFGFNPFWIGMYLF
jgi:hypothetical protein